MTEPYDPYRRDPKDPYRQGPQDQPPYGAQYGGQQPGGPYQGSQPYQGQPPYQEQYGPYQGGQHDPTSQYDPYATQQYGPHPSRQPYQGSYGQPAGWGVPGGPVGPPPQPPRKSKTPVIIAVLAALLLIGGGVAATFALRGNSGPSAAPTSTASASDQPSTTARRQATTRQTTTAASDDFQVGQCATLTPQQNNRATIKVTNCGGLLSDVVIAKVQSSECAEPYLSFDPGKGKVYCLAMDAKEGDCFNLDNLIKRAIACTGDQTRKVIKIYDGVADDKRCAAVPETIDVYTYSDPPKTLCLGKADL